MGLVAAGAVQGIGGGGILPIAQAIIADLVSPRERPRYQTQSALMFMIASVVVQLLGGFFTDHLHWSLIFWINVPMGILAVVISYRALERLPRNELAAHAGLDRSRPHGRGIAGPDAGDDMGRRARSLVVGADLSLIAGSAGLWLLFGWRSPRRQNRSSRSRC